MKKMIKFNIELKYNLHLSQELHRLLGQLIQMDEYHDCSSNANGGIIILLWIIVENTKVQKKNTKVPKSTS